MGFDHFVGRRQQVAILETLLDAALRGRGSLAMLVGENGAGKTRITQEISQRASARGLVALRAACREDDWRPAYAPWGEAIWQCIDNAGHHRWLRGSAPFLPPIAQMVPEVRARLPDTPVPTPLSADEERLRLFDAVVQFLVAAAKEAPLLLVLDDLHWADRDSLRLLRHVARFTTKERLLVVGTYREPELGLNVQHPLAEALAELLREPGYEHVSVPGFTYEELSEYLAKTIDLPLPAQFAEHLLSETNGNPFFIREIVKSLAERQGTTAPDPLPPARFAIREIGIPRGVREVAGWRVSRLSPVARDVLSRAAAFTHGFQIKALQSLTGLSDDSLLKALDEALEAGFIQVLSRNPPIYDFTHSIVRYVLYDQLNPDRQARLHRRVAAALEEVYSGHELEHAAELASQYHASASLEGAERGIVHALAAARQAKAAYAHERVVDFLRMASDLAAKSEPATRADVLCRLSVAEAEALMLDDAERSVTKVLAIVKGAKAEPGVVAACMAKTARGLKDGGARPDTWEPLVERGLAVLLDRRDLTWARLELLMDRFEAIPAGPVTAIRWLSANPDAVAIARAHGGEDDFAMSLLPPAWRSYAETEELFDVIRGWRQSAAKLRVLDIATRDLVEIHYAFREALQRLEEMLELSAQCGSMSGQAEAFFQMAGTWLILGDFELAEQAAVRARELISRLGPMHRLLAIEQTLVIMRDYYLDAEWEKVLAAVQGLGTTMAEQKRNPFALAGLAGIIIALARTGKGAEARHLLAALTPVAMRIEPTARGQNAVVTGAASAVWELGLVEYAPLYRDLALNLIESNVGGGPIGPNELAVARMAALLGEMAEAAEYFDRSRRVVDALGMRHMRAIIDLDEALAHARTGTPDNPRAAALVRAALRGFRECGMTGWQRRALELHGEISKALRVRPQSQEVKGKALTRRQIQVLRMVAGGRSNKEIATELALSLDTVDRHLANIYTKLGVHNRTAATGLAIRQNIVDPDELHQLDRMPE